VHTHAHIHHTEPVKLSEVTAYGDDDLGSIPGRDRNLSLCHHIQTGSGTHQGSYLLDIWVSFPRDNVTE